MDGAHQSISRYVIASADNTPIIATPNSAALYRLSWAQRLKRVFAIDIERCEGCGGKVKIIACIQDPEVIEKILRHLEKPAPLGPALPREPPPGTAGLFD